jgi:hypothetical protein
VKLKPLGPDAEKFLFAVLVGVAFVVGTAVVFAVLAAFLPLT